MKRVLLYLLFFFQFSLLAQWNALPPAISPYNASNPGSCWNSLTLPELIMPTGKGKIVYTSYCYLSPSSGGQEYFQFSKADLSSMQVRKTYSGMGCCSAGNFYSANDTCISYVINSFGYTSIYYTPNNFTTLVPMHFGSFFQVTATSISPNFVYSLYLNSGVLTIRRNYKAGTFVSQTPVTLYSSVNDKLQFINDSTGFTIGSFNSNTSKTTLLKTTDYGNNWTAVIIDSVNPIKDYHILPSGKGYVCKLNGDAYYTSNFGNSWIYKGSVPSGSYTALRFMNDSCGYIGGAGGTLYKTINYGATFTAEVSNTTQQIENLYTFDSVAYFVDANKKVFKNSGLLYQVFNSSSLSNSSTMACIDNSATCTYTAISNSGGPYNIYVQSPVCTTSYTSTSSSGTHTLNFNCAGVYTLNAYDGVNNLLGTISHSVSQTNTHTITIFSSKDTICVGESANLSFPTSGPGYTVTSFMWYNTQTYQPLTVTPVNPGVSTHNFFYCVSTTGTKTCNVTGSKNLVTLACVGINELAVPVIKIYPNPTNDIIHITCDLKKENTHIELYNVIGEKILSIPYKTEIDVSKLAKGYYILKLITYDHREIHSRMIKE